MTLRIGTISALALLLTGCQGIQSVLDPQGPQASRIASLWWVMLIVCTIVLAIVCTLVVLAVVRARGGDEDVDLTHRQKWRLVIAGGVVVPAFVLLGLLTYSVVVGTAMVTEPAGALRIQVVGHQWWWQVRYPGEKQSNLNVTTANEIHIPVGRPVSIELTSRDVIHSFWVPNLHGKTDAIPGRTTHTWIQADRAGTWRGQCAEFCGLQHAHMAFVVVAHSATDFDRWLQAQREPAREPVEALAIRGQQVFVARACALCHTVRGTPALATAGPDLTHIASRRTLASGTVPNTRGHLAGWILDPQVIKPGVRMPATQLSSEDLHALLAYLNHLK